MQNKTVQTIYYLKSHAKRIWQHEKYQSFTRSFIACSHDWLHPLVIYLFPQSLTPLNRLGTAYDCFINQRYDRIAWLYTPVTSCHSIICWVALNPLARPECHNSSVKPVNRDYGAYFLRLYLPNGPWEKLLREHNLSNTLQIRMSKAIPYR